MQGMRESPEVAELVIVLNGLIASVMPYTARHRVDRCWCDICNKLRRQIVLASKTAEKYNNISL